MPSERVPRRDPRRRLARLVLRLEEDGGFVTLDDIQAAARRSMRTQTPDGLERLVDDAVADSLLLKDRRTFFDRREVSLTAAWVYRVNPRHPLVRDEIEDASR
jgi:hypothetical protein